MKTGRKSMKDEIKIVQHMAELSDPVFKFMLKMAKSKEKSDNKWAAEQMMKLYMKAIPQEIVGDPENPIPILNVLSNNSHAKDQQPQEANPGSAGGDISQQDHIDPAPVDPSSTVG